MIPEKIGPSFNVTINSVESIVDWFEQRKQSFYPLGWCYLRSQEQMEELFYRTIVKVHKELPRFKRETSFETWVTYIFVHTCRELSNDRSLQASEKREPRLELFKALDQLGESDKDAMVLTYIKGLSQEEAAHLLHVSVEKLKEHLFSGIQSLRKEMGYGSLFHGCKEYHKNYIDYLERTMDRSKKVDFEIHIYHCQDCQEDLAAFQEVMLTMVNLTERMKDFHVPSNFMENIKARLAEKEKKRQQKNKKRIKIGGVIACVVALLIVLEVFTGAFSKLYYTWTEDNQELRAFLQQDLGESLNLEAESDGVKIKIKSVIADDIQTLVFYEIEDTKEENQYMIDMNEGISVENQLEIMARDTYPRYYPPDPNSDVNNEEKNVYRGKISLQPLLKDNGTIKLNISRLEKLNPDSSDRISLGAYEIMGFETGEWNFEIPVTKKASVEYALNGETEVEGFKVRFDKLIIAPTETILHFAIHNEMQQKQIQALNFDNLAVNDKKLKADLYGSTYSFQSGEMIGFQAHFDPLFGEKPKEVRAQFGSIHLNFEDQKTIELDASQKYPQTFEYAGSTISIDKVEVGQPSWVVISNHDIKNRAYGSLNFNVLGTDETEMGSMEMNSEGVYVDKNGKEYDINNMTRAMEDIEQPRYFFTVENIGMHSNKPGENVIPKRLEILGYSTMKYLDDVVKISLK
ncbi:sigma-70 family RNA polymerase sigma factor [Neobacillus sp. K501]